MEDVPHLAHILHSAEEYIKKYFSKSCSSFQTIKKYFSKSKSPFKTIIFQRNNI